MNKILVFGDEYGVSELLERISKDRVSAIIAAGNRPQYHEGLQSIAKGLNINFFVQPIFHNNKAYDQFVSDVKELAPDGLLCHSYSMLIRPDILQLVNGLALNIHASLLPRNRGPNPVQWALIHGEDKTGVTLHVMDEKIDCGMIVDQQEVEVLITDTWITLMERVKLTIHTLMDRALPRVLDGVWIEKEQDAANATVNQRITSESFEIDFSTMTDFEIFNLIRAQVSPLAGVYFDSSEGRRRFPDYLTIEEVALLRKELGKNV